MPNIVVVGAQWGDEGKGKIGTTGRGIGPCYEDKVARRGIRVGDLEHPSDLFEMVERRCTLANFEAGNTQFDAREVMAELQQVSERLLPYVRPTGSLLHGAIRRGESILFEGAQGTFLDVDHGTYPYVTSSNTVAGAAAAGSGVGPGALIDRWDR